MRFIIHAGMEKTGTTSLQKFLYDNRDALLKELGVLYPLSYISGRAHYFYSSSYLRDFKKHFSTPDIRQVIDGLSLEIEKKEPEIVLISCEYMFQNLYSDLKILLEMLKRKFKSTEVDLVTYIRRQDDWIESMIKQAIKDPLVRASYIDEYTFMSKSFLDYYIVFEKLRTLNLDKIYINIYSKSDLYQNNIIKDFFKRVFDIKIEVEKVYKENPSLSAESALTLKKLNKELELTPQDHSRVVDFLIRYDTQYGSRLRSLISLDSRLKILERFRESNEKLFREYFGTENQFVLTEEEIEFYKEQDKIPKEVVEKAVEERYRKVLEFMKVSGIIAKERLFPKVRVNYLPNNNLEFFRIDVLHANLLNGRLTVGGLALPKKDIEEIPKLTIRDVEGVKEVQWGLPSPVFGEQRKDNPKAKNARFRVDGIVVADKPIEVYLGGEKIAEIVITK